MEFSRQDYWSGLPWPLAALSSSSSRLSLDSNEPPDLVKGVFLVAQTVKNLPAMQETWVRSLGWEDPLEKGMATRSSILAWRIHGQRSLVGYSPWGHKSQT